MKPSCTLTNILVKYVVISTLSQYLDLYNNINSRDIKKSSI